MCICLNMCSCVSMSVWGCVPVRVSTSVGARACAHMSGVRVPVRMSASVVGVPVRVSASVGACACVCVHVCGCVYLCMCLCLGVSLWEHMCVSWQKF